MKKRKYLKVMCKRCMWLQYTVFLERWIGTGAPHSSTRPPTARYLGCTPKQVPGLTPKAVHDQAMLVDLIQSTRLDRAPADRTYSLFVLRAANTISFSAALLVRLLQCFSAVTVVLQSGAKYHFSYVSPRVTACAFRCRRPDLAQASYVSVSRGPSALPGLCYLLRISAQLQRAVS